MRIAYPASFARGTDGRITVRFRDFPEAATDGADMGEARAEAVDLIDSTIMFRMKYREPLPAPSRPRKGEVSIVPDAAVAMKAALYIVMRERGISAAELSRRLKVDYREAQRIVNPQHATRTARMSEALAATGHRAVLEVEPA
jgi:antitoxin HicB